MIDAIAEQLHYGYRSARLMQNMIGGGLLHCNLQITYRCNFKCIICDFWKTKHDPKEDLSLDEIRVIGRKLNEIGTMIISLAGGEPLIRQDLCEIIGILNKANHFPILITNGWFVNETVAKDLSRAGLQEISVSVDYANPERHDTARGAPGAWKRAVKALELLHRHRKGKMNRVHMISVLMDDNLEEIEPLIQLARDLGITYMVNLYSWNRGNKPRRLPDQTVTRHLLDLKRKYKEFISFTSYLEKMDEAIAQGGIADCQTGRRQLNIDNRGNVARCTETLDEPVANILTDEMSVVRERLLERQRSKDCAQCWTSCRGFAEAMYQAPRLRQYKEFLISVKPHPR
jgi:radical SAM protein with 4Fe4S-binding SPASM domain